jgi:hypothetical protein
MLALGHVASQFWVVGAKKGEFFVAPVVEGHVRNGHG